VAWLAISLISVVTVGPSMGAAPGTDVADGAGMLVGNGEAIGTKVSVAWAIGEQAASPPSIPSAATFKASLREILLVMAIPPKSKPHNQVSRLNFMREIAYVKEKRVRGLLEKSTYLKWTSTLY